MTYEEVYEKLTKLQWLLHRQQIMGRSAFGEMADTTRGQGRVLAVLQMQDGIPTKELAYIMGIRQQSLNELLNKLEKKAYLVRQPSAADKRIMVVQLTEKGRTAKQPEFEFAGMFQCLNEEELTQFGGYLDRIIGSFEETLGDPADQDWQDWMRKARERMGEEQVEQLTRMHRGGFGREERDRFGRNRKERGRMGMGGGRTFGDFSDCGPGSRGPMPENRPGAEGFRPDYEGPMPARGFDPRQNPLDDSKK